MESCWTKSSDSNSIWENNNNNNKNNSNNSNNQRRREFNSTCCFVETICVDSLIHGKELFWKDAFKVHQSTKKKTFDWDADFRLWGTAPSCLSHQSLNLVNWILTFAINNFCLFFGLGLNLPPEYTFTKCIPPATFFCLRLQRVRRGAAGACLKHGWMEVIGHHSTKQIPATGRAYPGTNSKCPHCYHGFLSDNLRLMESGWHQNCTSSREIAGSTGNHTICSGGALVVASGQIYR